MGLSENQLKMIELVTHDDPLVNTQLKLLQHPNPKTRQSIARSLAALESDNPHVITEISIYINREDPAILKEFIGDLLLEKRSEGGNLDLNLNR